MAENNLRLRVILDMVDRVVAPLKRVTNGSTDAARALKAARDRLKELNQQQGALANVQRQQTEFARLNNELKIKQSLLAGLKASGTATAAQIGREEKAVASLASALAQQRERAGQARIELSKLGVTGNLSAAQTRLKTDINQTTSAIDAQRQHLKRLADQQRRVHELNARHAKAMMHTGMAAGAGIAMAAGGRRGVQSSMAPVRDFSLHQDHMLGVARQVKGARDDAGNLTPVYRAIEEQVRGLSHQIPLATTAITDMVTAAARMEVPTDKLAEFALLSSEMATAFDAVPDEIAESMGKIANNLKIPITQIRGMADAINYLDDNAISKGADIIGFLNRVGGVAGTVGITGQNMAALGSTLLTSGETEENAGTAVKAIFTNFAAATKGTKRFRGAVAEIGMTPDQMQAGMADDAVGTLLKVAEAIRKLPKKDQLGVMAELAGKEHVGRLAKLVTNTEELRRQIALANGAEAQGSMAREAAARNANLSAQWQMTRNRAFNLSSVVGEQLEPVLLNLLRVVNPLLEGFRTWVQEHPVLVKWILTAAVGISALVAALGFALVPLALIAGKVLLVRFLLQRLAITTGGPLLGALRAAGGAVVGIGRALLMTPLGAIVGGIALAGLLIYKYWQPLAAFFSGLWTGFSDAMAPAFAAVGAALGPLRPVLDWLMGALGGAWNWFTALLSPMQATESQLAGITNAGQFLGQVLGTLVMGFLNIPSAFLELGQNVIAGFVNGITAGAAFLRDAVVGVASSIKAWFREAFGIASPSKVFMQYGGWISEGAAIGIAGGQDGVRRAALGVATAATLAMPMAAGAGGLQIDGRPPLTAQAMAGGGAVGGSSYQITINAAPGMNEQALARAVSAELDRRERAKRSRVLSTFADID